MRWVGVSKENAAGDQVEDYREADQIVGRG